MTALPLLVFNSLCETLENRLNLGNLGNLGNLRH